MEIISPLMRTAVKPLATWLNQPYTRYAPAVVTDPEMLGRGLLPGDVILVEGNTRFAALVRTLTQSTWSHVAMFVGPLGPGPDPACIVEADLEQGVRAIALSELRGMHTRAVRANGLEPAARAEVARRVRERIGEPYDLDCALAFARSLWSSRPQPPRARLVATPQAAICSTLLAEAFEAQGYPVLPARAASLATAVTEAAGRILMPRDFDVSPFFGVVAPCEPRVKRPSRCSMRQAAAHFKARGVPALRAPVAPA
jgi:hypothetical protein